MADVNDADTLVRDVLRGIFPEDKLKQRGAFVRAGMNIVELPRLYEMVRRGNCTNALEVGMANGTSSIAISLGLRDNGGGSLTSVDPYQTLTKDGGFASAGIENLAKAGLDENHRLIDKPDFLALPGLVQNEEKYDFILVDGYHSLDYTVLDMFYADLLLSDGGMLCVHDSSWPAVYHACRFLESHKPYELESPPPVVSNGVGLIRRIWRHLSVWSDSYNRSEKWNTLVCYRKIASKIAPERVCDIF